MPAGNFDDELTINSNGGVDAKGPLKLDTDEVMESLYVWVFQPPKEDGQSRSPDAIGPGASCVDAQTDSDAFSADRTRWSTQPNRIVEGTFAEGKATAMALAISRVADGSPRESQVRRIFWWEETVELKR